MSFHSLSMPLQALFRPSPPPRRRSCSGVLAAMRAAGASWCRGWMRRRWVRGSAGAGDWQGRVCRRRAAVGVDTSPKVTRKWKLGGDCGICVVSDIPHVSVNPSSFLLIAVLPI